MHTNTAQVNSVGVTADRGQSTQTAAAAHSGIRTLPLRVDPLPGEALESWMAALAYRHDTTWGELLDTVLPPTRADPPAARTNLTSRLTAVQRTQICHATGIAEQVCTAMTLSVLADGLVSVDPDRGIATTPWGAIGRQRFCPLCLRENGGRWELRWRLPWICVCQRHHCYLSDTCAVCGRYQDIYMCWCNRKFRPPMSRCRALVESAPPDPKHRCNAPLTRVKTDRLPVGHPILTMQHRLEGLLSNDRVSAGTYREYPVSAGQFLVDLRRLAQRILRSTTAQALAAQMGTPRHSRASDYWAVRVWTDPDGSPAREVMSRRSAAAAAAAGLTAALRVLDASTVAAAAAQLRTFTDGDYRARVDPAKRGRGHPSPVVCGIDIASWAPYSGFVTDQLRYRTAAALPSYPSATTTTTPILRRVPTVLWPELAFPLSVPEFTPLTQQQTLAVLVVLTGSTTALPHIATALRCRAHSGHVADVVAALHAHPAWPQIAAAIVRIHDRLLSSAPPIDYQRRRHLDYRGLLSRAQWRAVLPLARVRFANVVIYPAARTWLFTRLSAMPAAAAPFPRPAEARSDPFLHMLCPDLIDGLDEIGAAFLARRGVAGEPVSWRPPPGMLDDTDLPGPSVHDVPINALHRFLNNEAHGIYDAARHFRTTAPLIRHLLATQPMTRPRPRTPTQCELARRALSPTLFRRLYEHDGLTLIEIAHRVHINNAGHIAELAHDYGIALRHEQRTPITARWLRQQHLVQHRTVGEMATELAVTDHRIRYAANKYGIPLTTYYRRAQPDAAHVAKNIKGGALVTPALTSVAGWRRLQRFARACEHPKIAAAATCLGCRPDTLSRQVNGLERTLGRQLLVRATRNEPMQPTAFGTQIAATVRAIGAALDGAATAHGRHR
jgi:TniQ/Bacterial regulatory helix-turn-helix protein, lysR family